MAAIVLACVAALIVVLALIVDRVDSHGLNERQLSRIEATCEQRASVRSARRDVSYDEVFERCEMIEKTELNPDTLPPN